jgi:hypothetical protein
MPVALRLCHGRPGHAGARARCPWHFVTNGRREAAVAFQPRQGDLIQPRATPWEQATNSAASPEWAGHQIALPGFQMKMDCGANLGRQTGLW